MFLVSGCKVTVKRNIYQISYEIQKIYLNIKKIHLFYSVFAAFEVGKQNKTLNKGLFPFSILYFFSTFASENKKRWQ